MVFEKYTIHMIGAGISQQTTLMFKSIIPRYVILGVILQALSYFLPHSLPYISILESTPATMNFPGFMNAF